MTLLIALLLSVFVHIGSPELENTDVEVVECPFGNATTYQIDCVYVHVPADHAQPEGAMIRLAVAIIHSPSPQPDPIVFLAGGPGDDAVMRAPLTAINYAELLKSRDVILFDQRGSGLSEPRLDCPQLASTTYADAVAFEHAISGVTACSHQHRIDNINSNLFNTQQSASDVPFLISALGYETANLLGISYGTRLGLTVISQHPEQIRSAVLDSVSPLQINVYEQIPSGFDRALGEVEAACQSDLACRLAYPNLRERFYRLFERLEAQPIRVQGNGNQTQHQITGQLLSQYILMSLYRRETISSLPAALSRLEDGDYTPIVEWLDSIQINSGGRNVGMMLAVMCADQGLRTSPEYIQRIDAQYQAALSPDFGLFGSGGANLCQAWGGEYVTPDQNRPAVSAVPTLLLAGQFDPVTPPSWAHLASETLSNSTVIELANTGHGVTFTQCGLQFASAFFADPTHTLEEQCSPPTLTFDLSESVTRPVISGLTLLLGIVSLSGGLWALNASIRRPEYFSWRNVRKQFNIYWLLSGVVLIVALLNASGSVRTFLNIEADGLIGLVFPLIVGLQSALLFSPHDEPALEVIAACPRGIGWLITERWLGVCISQWSFAAAAMLVSSWLIPGQDPVLMLARWLPPAILFSGLAIFITIRSRVAAFGLVMTGVIWLIFVGFGDLLLPGALPLFFPLNYIQPFLWGIHPYLQPEALSDVSYWLNRLCVGGLGFALLISAVYGLRSEEQLLFDRKPQ